MQTPLEKSIERRHQKLNSRQNIKAVNYWEEYLAMLRHRREFVQINSGNETVGSIAYTEKEKELFKKENEVLDFLVKHLEEKLFGMSWFKAKENE